MIPFRLVRLVSTILPWLTSLAPAALRAQDTPACGTTPSVFGVSTQGQPLQSSRTRPIAFIEDYVTIGVCQLDSLLHQAQEQHADVTLFMNGLDMGVTPARVNLDGGTLTFTLDRTHANAAVWQPVLYNPFFQDTATVFVSVGLAGGTALSRVDTAPMLIEFHKLWVDWTTRLWGVFMIAVWVATIWLGMRTDMLREGPSTGGIRQPYSLGRIQMALWFLLIVLAYIGIWLVTGDRDTLTPSILALAGISAATGLTSAAVTPPSVTRANALRSPITEEIVAHDKTMEHLSSDLQSIQDPSRADMVRRLLGVRQDARQKLAIELATVPAVFASRGIVSDLITDDRGSVALDRVQIVVWTVVLMGLFLYSVGFEMVMPEFSATMLGLMGISSGTYVGFKLPAVKQ